ncbi:MAG TPA: NUDIX domain-containing protein [Candidatus Paceibacterota bacterium]
MEEYIDIVDASGNPTGEKKLKSLAHKNGDRHKTVHIWIINLKGELLIQRRSLAKENYPNLWDISCAGHISAGETPLQAAVREAKEELNVIVDEQDLEYLFTINSPRVVLNNGAYIDHEFQDIYLLKLDDDIPGFKLQTEEVAETKWVPWRELQSVIRSGDITFVPHQEEYDKLFDFLTAE